MSLLLHMRWCLLQVQGVSVDEAYADVTAVVEAMEGPQDLSSRIRTVAENLKRAVRDATECNASVGSGPNRLLARMATSRAKPDGYFHISSQDAIQYLDPLAVRSLPGVGYNTVEKLGKIGVSTVSELRAKSRIQLKEHLGDRVHSLSFLARFIVFCNPQTDVHDVWPSDIRYQAQEASMSLSQMGIH